MISVGAADGGHHRHDQPGRGRLVPGHPAARARPRLRRLDARLRRVPAAERADERRAHRAGRCTTRSRSCTRRRPSTTCAQVRGDDFMFFARAGYTGTQAVRRRSSGPAIRRRASTTRRGCPAQRARRASTPACRASRSGAATSAATPASTIRPPTRRSTCAGPSSARCRPTCTTRTPARGAAGAPPKWTLWSDAETTAVYGDYARLHTRLFPYTLRGRAGGDRDGPARSCATRCW